MTDTEINIAIAETCGFSFCRSEISGGSEQWHDCDGEIVHTLPNYCQDLNAMYQAEETLGVNLQEAFLDALDETRSFEWEWNCCHATARQRAVAFLKATMKWTG